jgi:hypothetical protein
MIVTYAGKEGVVSLFFGRANSYTDVFCVINPQFYTFLHFSASVLYFTINHVQENNMKSI